MADGIGLLQPGAIALPQVSRKLQFCLLVSLSVLLAVLLAAWFLPKSFALAVFGDSLQFGLIAAATLLTLRNSLQAQSRARIFWLLMFTGSLLWAISTGVWDVYELWFNRPVPDVAIVDFLLFVKVVPLTAAIAVRPDALQDVRFRAFGLLDVSVLIVYSFYLFAFGVFAFRLLPGAKPDYDFYFNLADAIGNQILVVATGIAVLRAHGLWRNLHWLYFFSAACYGIASNLSNFAIDAGRYYTGCLYDVPLIASLLALVCLAFAGDDSSQGQPIDAPPTPFDAAEARATFFSEHLAMLVVLSTPVLGICSLSDPSSPPQLRPFRITITLIALFLMTLLLSVKEDILAAGLFQSLQQLSETHSRIERFRSHLTQGEKLAALGKLVAQVANHIKACMASTLEASSRLTARPDADMRVQNMAGKIGQCSQRTDALVQNMLHFAQETPLRLEPLDVKPLLESALHLSRIAKLPLVHVNVAQEENCPPVRGDSGQLLQVFLQLIANAIDALEATGGGTFQITLRPAGSKLLLEFADSGSGLLEPQRVFEPFYTTKPVGKGTGLGLSTCYGIIQQHEGEISCRNGKEGGAVFTILLPFASTLSGKEALQTDLLMKGSP
ncbi:MAG TPA: ATP-binding protein [Verrucomicrobiae bacterium]|nr:ATP-binding protein [Verrucomicrobiae bacterium]